MATRNKTHRGACKRFRRTANGFKRKQANHRHLFAGKSMKRKRRLRSTRIVDKSDQKSIARMLNVT